MIPDTLGNGARVLLLLVVANSAPWLVGRFSRGRAPVPMDFGLTLWDGQRLFGSHKSWRGFVSGVVASAIVGRLCGLGWWVGGGCGALSLLGDAISSAIKRRLHRPPGTDVPLVDQLPEALAPLLLLWPRLALSGFEAAAVGGAFVALDLLVTRRWLPVGGRRPSVRSDS